VTGQGVFPVMLAKPVPDSDQGAGIQVNQLKFYWIPAFAGMTDFIAENSPTSELSKFRVKVFFPSCLRKRSSSLAGLAFLDSRSVIGVGDRLFNNDGLYRRKSSRPQANRREVVKTY
jgi:hypothetical protein